MPQCPDGLLFKVLALFLAVDSILSKKDLVLAVTLDKNFVYVHPNDIENTFELETPKPIVIFEPPVETVATAPAPTEKYKPPFS